MIRAAILIGDVGIPAAFSWSMIALLVALVVLALVIRIGSRSSSWA